MSIADGEELEKLARPGVIAPPTRSDDFPLRPSTRGLGKRSRRNSKSKDHEATYFIRCVSFEGGDHFGVRCQA
jgi:hypothetical protein